MQRKITRLFLLLVFVISCAFSASVHAADPVKGVIRIKVQSELTTKLGAAPLMRAKSSNYVKTGITPLDAASQKVKAVRIKRMIPYSAKFEERHKKYGLDKWYEVSFDESISPEEAQKIFKATTGVQAVETIKPMELKDGNGKFVKVNPKNYSSVQQRSSYPFNDPMLPAQWHYINDGTMAGSVAGADINLIGAWQIEYGKNDVLVAIVDGGIDYTHDDLKDNVYVNQAELNGIPGVDDDGNGYVDDIHGYNFVTKSAEIYPHNHGTHVAGTVGATNGNGIGVCGVAGGNGTGGVKMISCQTFDSRSNSDGNFAEALIYAADMGASIAQCSWGWAEPGYYEQAVLDAIDYFTEVGGGDKMKGGLCIFATGNEGAEGDYYPARYDKTLSVTSMTYDKRAASYSCYGSWADVIAPGGDMTYASEQGVLSTLPDNSYGYNEGTSMATPHVSGVAALVLSKYGKPDLLNETLRQQLVTSVNDFYSYNPTLEGRFGSGYIDAEKALHMGTGEAPDAVSDFTLTPSQDNILVEWVIPNSSDNNVNHHVVYYSTTPFTSSTDLNTVSSKVVDTKFKNSGDNVAYEIVGLNSTTTYYVAIKSVDRWGNAAELSQVKSATTNSGPKMEIDNTNLTMTASADAPVGSAQFTISNTDEGLLKWASYTRTTSVQPASVTKPNPGRISSASFKAVGKEAVAKEVVKSDEYVKEDYPKTISYFDLRYAYIGEQDIKLPNSEAQWFYVDPQKYPEGFNLTSLTVGGSYGENPTIQIYNGSTTISKASLIQTVDYGWFAYNYPLNLQEQLYFAPGESFWVVIHYPAGQLNPLGVGATTEATQYSNYSYMSNDGGATWKTLKEALKGSTFEADADKCVWEITCTSNNPDWSTVMKLSPSEGQVKPGESQTVTVSNDGQKLVNGTYKFNLKLTSNESNAEEKAIATRLTVSGYAPELTCAKVVNFGDLLVGQSKTLSVEVVNRGFGGFYGSEWGHGIYNDKISCSSVDFVPSAYVSSGFAARSTTTYDITYKPQTAGSHNGVVTLKDKDGRTFNINVHGVASDPSKISIDPKSIDAGNIEVGGAEVQKTFTISNTGSYPLEYVMPKYSDETIENQGTKSVHKAGYEYVSNLNGSKAFSYDGNPALVNATDITKSFNDNVYYSDEIDLGFDFPYYGKNYNKVYVTSFGGIVFDNTSVLRGNLDAASDIIGKSGLISAYGSQLMMGPNSKVRYAKQDGKFVVKFENVKAVVYDVDYTDISFHMTLAPSGDIEIFYDSYAPDAVFQQGRTLFVGVNDPDVSDPLTVTSSSIADPMYSDIYTEAGQVFAAFGNGSAVKFLAPDANFISSVNPASGIVNPGDTQTFTATLKATDAMYAGEITNKLVIISNDPVTPTDFVTFKANVTGDLNGEVALASETLDFGKVFRTAKISAPITVKNTGRDSLIIQSVTLESGKFNYTIATPSTVAAGASKDILVTIPTTVECSLSDVMTITTNVGTIKANINGEVIGTPEATLNMNIIVETLESGSKKNEMLTVKNNGNEPLNYSIGGTSFTTVPTIYSDNVSTGYTYKSSVDDENVKFNWVDIVSNGKGEQHNLTYYLSHDYNTVKLPFEFPFYGKKYKTMYIYNGGFVSFTERPDQKMWPEPDPEFPHSTLYNNMLAPYWGVHSPDNEKTSGTFYYADENQAVVSFIGYSNTMNIGVCYQVIMNRDGSFKYQYQGRGDNALIWGLFGCVGCNNEGGTEGINIPERYVKFGEAIEFSPVLSSQVAPGGFHNVAFDLTANQMAGHYTSSLDVATNVPGREKISIPIDLTITGKAKAVYPASLEGQYVIGTTDFDAPAYGMGRQIMFNIANDGTAPFTVTSVDMSQMPPVCMLYDNGQHIDPWFGDITVGWGQYDNSPFEVTSAPKEFALLLADVYNVADYEFPITFNVSGIEGVSAITIPVKLSVTPAPAISLSTDSIVINHVDEDFSAIKTLTLGNPGEYKLTYQLSLDMSGVGEVIQDNGGGDPGIMMTRKKLATSAFAELKKAFVKGSIKAMDETKSASTLDVPSDINNYTNALYYPAGYEAGAYMYGTGSAFTDFKAATFYEAPAEGFNVNSVYTAYFPEGIENKDIKVEIIGGDDIEGTNILAKGSYHFAAPADPTRPQMGEFIKIPLNHDLYLAPGQKFYVVITYPTDVKLPCCLTNKEEATVANRYMAWTDSDGWIDLGTYLNEQNGSMGYVMTLLEKEKGEPWVTLEDATNNGTIEVNSSHDVKLNINAKFASLDAGNRAVIVIKSDDPTRPVINFPVVLNKNAAPVITAPEGLIYAGEGKTTDVIVEVADADGDAFTVSVPSTEMATLVGCEDASSPSNVTKNADGSYSVAEGSQGVRLTVAVTPDYGTAGSYSFDVKAEDSHSRKSSATLSYYVSHVNRAPVAKTLKDVTITTKGTSDIISFEDMFEDPDNDDLTYTMTVDDESKVAIFQSGNSVIFAGKTVGQTLVTVNADDGKGGLAAAKFNVVVTDATAIDALTNGDSDVNVYPNPVVDNLNINVNSSWTGAVKYQLFDMSGAMMYDETANVGGVHRINMSGYKTDNYILKVTNGGKSHVVRIVKK